MRIQYWMAGKLTLFIVAAMLVLVTNVAADPKVGPTQSLLLSPQSSTVNQNNSNRSAFDQFHLQDTSPANSIIFWNSSSLINLQGLGTITKLNQEVSSEPSTDTWRPGQPPKLNNQFFLTTIVSISPGRRTFRSRNRRRKMIASTVMTIAPKIQGFRIPGLLRSKAGISIVGISVRSENRLSACLSAYPFSETSLPLCRIMGGRRRGGRIGYRLLRCVDR